VSDLDGTLWEAERQLHPRTRTAIDELARHRLPADLFTEVAAAAVG
jgi:hydroxymethylpyrimidine pyrophosphatase-like HAD family hydrolase